MSDILKRALGILAEYRFGIHKQDLDLRAATLLGDMERDHDEPTPFTLQIEFDDAADYKRAWLAIEQMPEVVNIGFLSGSRFEEVCARDRSRRARPVCGARRAAREPGRQRRCAMKYPSYLEAYIHSISPEQKDV